MADTQKLDFAHALRGLAALLVAFSHLIGFWLSPAGTIFYLHSPARADAGVPWLATTYFSLVPGVASSQFAIALFFLISGFVIPFAFLTQSPSGFLVGRFFRIWPLYAAGLAISIVSVAGVSAFFGRAYIPSALDVVAHLTFIQDIAGVTLIDGIVWTLNIEVRFYLVCALIAPWLAQAKAPPIVALALAGAIPAVAAALYARNSTLALGLASTWMFMSLMFVGTIWNFVHRGRLSIQAGVICSALLLLAFGIQCHFMPFATTSRQFIYPGPQFLWSYLAGAGAFLVFFAFRGYFPKIRVLSHLGDISYPLYVIHAMLGTAIMRVLAEFTTQFDLVLLGTLAIVWGVSYLAHIAIETPTHEWGRAIAYRRRLPAYLRPQS